MGRGDGERSPERELPGAGESREVSRRRRGGREVDRPCERGSTDDDEEDQQPAKPEGEQQGKQRRPDEVKLLLDRERPEVEERRGRLPLREVVAALACEVDVGGKERRPDAVVDGLTGPDEIEQMMAGDVGDD